MQAMTDASADMCHGGHLHVILDWVLPLMMTLQIHMVMVGLDSCQECCPQASMRGARQLQKCLKKRFCISSARQVAELPAVYFHFQIKTEQKSTEREVQACC